MSRLAACLLAALLACLPGAALAGSFGVSPIRLDLDRGTKSAIITVTNDDDKPLAFQVRAMRWSQDASGADQYAPSSDLVYFPQQLKIPPKESRVIRVGYKVPAIQAEQAFRVFIEELADPERDRSKTGVAIKLRFGVPVFLHPVTETKTGELTLSLADGVARARVRNTGNVHFRLNAVRVSGLDADGKALFERTLDGWYVLEGAERSHDYKLPAEECARARTLRAEAVAEKLVLRAERPLGPEDCR